MQAVTHLLAMTYFSCTWWDVRLFRHHRRELAPLALSQAQKTYSQTMNPKKIPILSSHS